MALTIGNLKYDIFGQRVITTGTIAFDSSYPTGGESLTAANIGMSVIDLILFQTTAGVVFEYDYTNSLVLAYIQGVTTGSSQGVSAGTTTGALAEDTAAAATVVRLLGTTADTTYNLGYLKQVPASTSLAAITGVRFIAFGV